MSWNELVFLMTALGALGACSAGDAATPERPNIVLLIADDQDNGHLGFEGHPLAITPNLDRLATEGVVFSTLLTPPRCRPSLATLLSGRYPHQSGIYFNRGERTLDPTNTLPVLLQEAGYATYAAGKFWEGDPQRMGFDAPPEEDRGLLREGQADLFRFVDEHAPRKPLFIWWAPLVPHLPHDPPERLLERIPREEIPIPGWFHGNEPGYREMEHKSLAMGAWFDEGVGQLMAKLEQVGVLENTLFFFLIDNGYCNGRVAKGSPFDQGIRTPLVVSWPGRIAGGRRLDTLLDSVDVYPTVLAYAGVEAPASAAGVNLRPLVEEAPGAEEALSRRTLFGAVYDRAASEDERPEKDVYAFYARTKGWKYIRYIRHVTPAFWDIMGVEPMMDMHRVPGDEELFDLRSDPDELENLAADPAQRQRMDRLLRGAVAWWRGTGGGVTGE